MRTPSSLKCRLDLAPPLADRFILDRPHRLRPGTSPHSVRIPAHDGHSALRSTTRGGFRSALAVSSFRLRARLDLSITFRFLRPARLRTPLLGYGAPHSSARGTSTLLNNALLSAHFRVPDQVRPTFVSLAIRSECRRCRSVARRTSVETPHGLAIRAPQPHNQRTAGTRVARRSRAERSVVVVHET
jgi:hypothetical protein